MTEADILALTYTDRCIVFRPVKQVLPSGETVFQEGLEGQVVYAETPCALSSPSGGKLKQGRPVARVETAYILFVRPEVDIQPGDTVVVYHERRRYEAVAGLGMYYPSGGQVPLKLDKDTV